MRISVLTFLLFLIQSSCLAIEIDGSPFATDDALVPQYIKPQGEKLILVDPKQHAWGAYNPDGKLLRWGLATAGADYCPDTGHPCRTKTGNFRIYSLGSADCISNTYPVPGGGAPMPYCMYFTANQAIHGSSSVQYGNSSHGCVRMNVDDAKWLRFKFVEGPTLANNYRGTKIIIMSY